MHLFSCVDGTCVVCTERFLMRGVLFLNVLDRSVGSALCHGIEKSIRCRHSYWKVSSSLSICLTILLSYLRYMLLIGLFSLGYFFQKYFHCLKVLSLTSFMKTPRLVRSATNTWPPSFPETAAVRCNRRMLFMVVVVFGILFSLICFSLVSFVSFVSFVLFGVWFGVLFVVSHHFFSFQVGPTRWTSWLI